MKKSAMRERILTLEKLLCNDGHTFVPVKTYYYGTGNGDEEGYDVGFCKVCLKEMTEPK